MNHKSGNPMRKQVYPEVAVGAFIINRKGELLLVTSYKWPSIYSVPGGHVELGESIIESTRREAKEEVGLDVKVKRVLNLQEAIYPRNFFKKRHFIFVDVLCTTSGAKPRLDNDEIQGYIWIRPKEALKLKLNSYTRKGIMQIISAKKLEWFYPEKTN